MTFVFEDEKAGYALFDGIRHNMAYSLQEDRIEITLDSIDYYEEKYGMSIDDIVSQGLIPESEVYFAFSGSITINGDKMVMDVDSGYTREFSRK